MYKAEAKLIIQDWQTLCACLDISDNLAKEIIEETNAESPLPNFSLHTIASAVIADEVERVSTKEVKGWGRYTRFILEYFVCQFEARGWCATTAAELKQELESLADSIPIYEIECKWQGVGPLAKSHHVWRQLHEERSESVEKLTITEAYEISHPMGNGSSVLSTARAAAGG